MVQSAFGAGFGLGLSLIMAIGAQNAFVLRQGLLRRHVGAVVTCCALSDALLILAGVAGFGNLSRTAPWLAETMRLGGAAFLLVYGSMAALRACKGGGQLEAENGATVGLWRSLATCLVLTWGNPHVYLDTVVMLGAVSADFGNRPAFALGAMLASVLFFAALGYGARLLVPLFRRPSAWRMLDGLVAIIMFSVAASLLLM